MAEFIVGGWWIALFFLGALFLYTLWLIYRGLDKLRDRDRRLDEGLGSVLLQYRIAMERAQQAASWVEDGEVDRAIQELKKIQETQPKLLTIDYFLGKAYLTRGDDDLAKTHFQRFLESAKPYDPTSKERLEEVRDMVKSLG